MRPLQVDSVHWSFLDQMVLRLKAMRFIDRECNDLSSVVCDLFKKRTSNQLYIRFRKRILKHYRNLHVHPILLKAGYSKYQL